MLNIPAIKKLFNQRSPIPILAMGRLHQGQLMLTNLDQCLLMPMPDLAQYSGIVAEPLRLLEAMKTGITTHFLDNEKLWLTLTTGAKFALEFTPNLQDFPDLAETTETPFSLAIPQFYEKLAQVAHCQSAEEVRYYLNGVFIGQNDTIAAMVATDGYRLALADIAPEKPLEGNKNGDFTGFIVPKAAVDFIVSQKQEPSLINYGQTRLTYITPHYTLITKRVDGAFSDFRRVIPAEQKGTVWLDLEPDSLAKALKGADKQKAAHINWHTDGTTATASNHDGQDVLYSAPFSGAIIRGADSFTEGFNKQYLIDFCKWMKAAKPDEIRSNGKGQPLAAFANGATYVLMPMRF
jgi:DNA polymerase-3 subunit beta